mgnify:FL=1
MQLSVKVSGQLYCVALPVHFFDASSILSFDETGCKSIELCEEKLIAENLVIHDQQGCCKHQMYSFFCTNVLKKRASLVKIAPCELRLFFSQSGFPYSLLFLN